MAPSVVWLRCCAGGQLFALCSGARHVLLSFARFGKRLVFRLRVCSFNTCSVAKLPASCHLVQVRSFLDCGCSCSAQPLLEECSACGPCWQLAPSGCGSSLQAPRTRVCAWHSPFLMSDFQSWFHCELYWGVGSCVERTSKRGPRGKQVHHANPDPTAKQLFMNHLARIS